MSNMHEMLEHMEHAGHAGHGGGHAGGAANTGKAIGITMAILGVLLAFCAAVVGSARTELVSTMVEQQNAHSKYQAQRMKHRVMVTQLQMLHALTPSHAELQKLELSLKRLSGKGGKEDSEDTAELKEAVALSTSSLVEILTPGIDDEMRFVELARAYEKEVEAANAWVESYHEAIVAYTTSAEHYEWAQLAAEVGIVIASIALLLSNRKAWAISIVLAIGCLMLIAWTYVTTSGHVRHAKEAIEETAKTYDKLRESGSRGADDERLLEEIERLSAESRGAAPRTHAPPAASAQLP